MLSAVIPSIHSYPAALWRTTGTPEVCSPRSSRTRGNSSQVSTPTADRDQTVSRRSEPSSRTTLIGEQPNPWDLLQPQDVMSRHRGAKRFRRYELLGIISLLSPAYLLSVERWPFHEGPPDHYDRLSSLLDSVGLAVRQAYAIALSQTVSNRPEPTIARLRYSLGGDRPSQTTRHRGSLHRITVRG
jgi:hypothetical protein